MPFPFLSLRDNLPPAHTHTHSRILSHSAGNRYGLLLMLLLLTGHPFFFFFFQSESGGHYYYHCWASIAGHKTTKKDEESRAAAFLCCSSECDQLCCSLLTALSLSLSLTSTTPNGKERGKKSKERVIVFVMSTALITVPASSAAVVLVTNELSSLSLSQLLLSYKTITIHTHWKRERGLSIYSIIFGNATTTTTFALHQWPPVSASNESFSVLLLLLLCLSFGDINCNHTSCTQALFGGA